MRRRAAMIALLSGIAITTAAPTSALAEEGCTTKKCHERVAKKQKIQKLAPGCTTYKCMKRVSRCRTQKCEQRVRERDCRDTNPVPCIRMASQKYGTPFGHLISCARSEGGLGPNSYRRMNTTGSGAGGIFQFMASTFHATIARMGLTPKPWLSAKWQANAAAWKFRADGTGEWTGPGC